MSAVVADRDKRKTAGKRMTGLVGKALEEDDTFWGHDTWAEDDSGNDSFHDSDEDSELRKDAFDSDFNDSESDNEDAEEAAGAAEERVLQQEERSGRLQRKTQYVDNIAKGGRAMLKKAKGVKGGGKRAMGDGVNTGIVLNFPSTTIPMTSSSVVGGPISSSQQTQAQTQTQTQTPLAPLLVVTSAQAIPPITTSPSSPKKVRKTLASVRERRSQTRKRDSRNTTPTYSATTERQGNNNNKKAKTLSGVTRKSKRRQYAQEELLLEAVHETEPGNGRWLLARKRVQESADQDQNTLAALRDRNRGKNVVQKYHSRRGCLITLTFPEMDAVPELLTRSNAPPPRPEPLICVITGKPARYRDPKTQMVYFDAKAFQELRRRQAAGAPLDQRPKPKPKPKPRPKVAVGGDVAPTAGTEAFTASFSTATKTNEVKKRGVSASKSRTTVAPLKSSPSSSATGFVVDLGGAPKSPGSTRSSSRKWKPSEKMLQGIVTRGTGSAKSTPTSQEKGTTNLGAPSTLPPPLPSIAPDGNITPNTNTGNNDGAQKPLGAVKASEGEAKTSKISKEIGSKAATKKEAPATKGSVTKASRNSSAPTSDIAAAGAAAASKEEANTYLDKGNSAANIDGPMAKAELVYVIPVDTENGIKEPKYVTQSELIMQAISSYSQHQQGRQHLQELSVRDEASPSKKAEETPTSVTHNNTATPSNGDSKK